MKKRLIHGTVVFAALLSVSACSSYEGIDALHDPSSYQDFSPPGFNWSENSPGYPTDFRLLVEHDGIQYFAAEKDDYTTACIGQYPLDGSETWNLGCGGQASQGEEAASVSNSAGLLAKLVTDDFDARELENSGWQEIHKNVLIKNNQ